MKPHPPWKSRREGSRGPWAEGFSPSFCADADHRAPRAALLAPVRPRALRAAQRRPRRRGVPQRRRALHARAERRAVRRHPGPLGPAGVRPVVRRRARGARRMPRLRRPGGALVPAVGAARGRGRLAPGPPGVGTRPGDRGRTSVFAPCLRGPRARGGDLDHRPGERALDPRGGEARDAPGARSRASANTSPIARIRDFLAAMRLFHQGRLDPRQSARIRSVQTRNRAAESEAQGLRGPPL